MGIAVRFTAARMSRRSIALYRVCGKKFSWGQGVGPPNPPPPLPPRHRGGWGGGVWGVGFYRF
ncbi:hypothetical protein N44_02063 [Microcystis aeruginosa NIES-44]|uniref:Uncharacterized protein n=1 Tax=Microcystis aeruginosa NIES-44 TaxID=449439 RepID=A0A0A1VVT0_MICAE|nr:hypothetical protein N44_02063 [Microcystis aeruginosa NIES-44]